MTLYAAHSTLLIYLALQAMSQLSLAEREARAQGSFSSAGDERERRRQSVGGGNEDATSTEHQQSNNHEEETASASSLFLNDEGGLGGLMNLGNTCYFNATTQCLLHCGPLVAVLCDLNKELVYQSRNRGVLRAKVNVTSKYDEFREVAVQFQGLCRRMWSGEYKVYNPRDLIISIQKANEYFRGYGQHDAHELLRCAIDALHVSTATSKYPPTPIPTTTPPVEDDTDADQKQQQQPSSSPPPPTTTTTSSCSSASASSADSESKPANSASDKADAGGDGRGLPSSRGSLVADMFQGSITSTVQCLSCKHRSDKVEPCFDLSLPIPSDMQLKQVSRERGKASVTNQRETKQGWFKSMLNYVGISSSPISLEACLHSYCTTEELVKDNQYKCGECEKRVNIRKYLTITELPQILPFHLKRFSYHGYGSKVTRVVSFPLEGLDMAPFLHREHKSEAEEEEEKQMDVDRGSAVQPKQKKKHIYYSLFGLVKHMGGTGGGHYVAYCRHHVTGKWFLFDDGRAKQVTAAHVLEQEAYILFYKQSTGQDLRKTGMKLLKSVSENWNQKNNTQKAKESVVSDAHVVVSRRWLRQLRYLSDAVPIDNSDLLCPHGKPDARVLDSLDELCFLVKPQGWQQLQARFGGDTLTVGDFRGEAAICAECEFARQRKAEQTLVETTDSDASKKDIYFYLIHAQWLSSWKQFCLHGKERPGPVSNHLLLAEGAEGDHTQPREGLDKAVDYRALDRGVFLLFIELYGGGPLVVRERYNVYEGFVELESDGRTVKKSESDGEAERAELELLGVVPTSQMDVDE